MTLGTCLWPGEHKLVRNRRFSPVEVQPILICIGRISNREGKRPENVGDHLKSADIEQPDFVVVGSKSDCGSGEDEDTMSGSEDKDENCVPKQLSLEPSA